MSVSNVCWFILFYLFVYINELIILFIYIFTLFVCSFMFVVRLSGISLKVVLFDSFLFNFYHAILFLFFFFFKLFQNVFEFGSFYYVMFYML